MFHHKKIRINPLQVRHVTSGWIIFQGEQATSVLIVKTRQAMKVERNIQPRWRDYCCRGKAITVTYLVRVSAALVSQHAKRMRRVTLTVACLALPCFSTLSHKPHDFREKKLNIKCASLQDSSETFNDNNNNNNNKQTRICSPKQRSF